METTKDNKNAGEDFKIQIDCPLCGEKELQVLNPTPSTQLMQCIACGYSTSTDLKGDKETNERFQGFDEQMKKWAVEKNGHVWTPSIVNLPIGIIYPEAVAETEDEEGKLIWRFARMVDVTEEEKEKYPRENGEGYYTKRYDFQNSWKYDTFKDTVFNVETNPELWGMTEEDFENAKKKATESKS